MDYSLFKVVNGPAGSHSALDATMEHAATWAVPVFIAIVVTWFVIGWVTGRPREREGALLALFGAGGALLVNQIIGHLWERPRPFAAHPDVAHLLVAPSTDPSFPSDHAAAAMAIAVAVVLFHRRIGVVAVALALWVAYARVFIGAHYPGDVLGGIAIGTAVTLILWGPLAIIPRTAGRISTGIIRTLRLPLPDSRQPSPPRGA